MIAEMVVRPVRVIGRCMVCDRRLVTPREAVRCEPCQARNAWPPWMAAELEAAAVERREDEAP